MGSAFWRQLVAGGLRVPSDRPLDELTAELTTMLGSPDPAAREETAYETLTTWLDRGVYDDLLAGLGDGMAAGLEIGLGETGTDTVFRRTASVRVLAACIDRDNAMLLLPATKLMEWGDRVAAWFVRERDLRGFVEGSGWAHTAATGADAVGALARSPHFGTAELTVLLDVIGDRLLLPTTEFLVCGEPDRLARATLEVLRRNVVPLSILEPWVDRLANGATGAGDAVTNPFHRTFNVEAFLRALHLQLVLGAARPDVRPDLLLVLLDALRSTNASDLA